MGALHVALQLRRPASWPFRRILLRWIAEVPGVPLDGLGMHTLVIVQNLVSAQGLRISMASGSRWNMQERVVGGVAIWI